MADSKQSKKSEMESVKITNIGSFFRKGRRFTNEEFRKVTGLNLIYKDYKDDPKIIYRSVTEILKIYIALGYIQIVKIDNDLAKKSRGRPQTIYECLRDLNITFPTINEVKEKYICRYCNKDITLVTGEKPKTCPLCLRGV